MSADLPNRIHMSFGERTFGCPFGAVWEVQLIHFPGLGHEPHFQAKFCGGLRADFTPRDFAEFLRQGQEEMSKLGYIPEIHDAAGGVE